MCGIAGLWDVAGRLSLEAQAEIVARMSRRLAHRGPDAHGLFVDDEAGPVFGHRRLAIVDISSLGAQPMVSNCGGYVIVFNGEVYNYRHLRRELESLGETFATSSDTEVLLYAIRRWGMLETLRRVVGMFALGCWDRRERCLWLARDRLGEKPLYYGRIDGAFAFASELKCFHEIPSFEGEISREALADFFRHGYVCAPRSIYSDVLKLEPGTVLRVRDAELPVAERYWSLADVAREGQQAPFKGSPQEAADLLEEKLRTAVRDQMVADVDVGAFLSGGIDSSTVVAVMQAECERPVRTFCVSFGDRQFNEAPYAARIAAHLGTHHTEIRVDARDALEVLPNIPAIYDEPMADFSQLPTCLVARKTREHVTVSLSADGGDELFGGYATYRWARKAWNALRLVPGPLRSMMRTSLAGTDVVKMVQNQRQRWARLLPMLSSASADELFLNLTGHWPDTLWPVIDVRPLDHELSHLRSIREPVRRHQLLDAMTYLPDDVLVKVDRAAMATSLESRAPLLDHRVVEFSFTLPTHLLYDRGVGKQPLRSVLQRFIPHHLFDRPKMGFSPPLAAWLRGELREWAESLLAKSVLESSGLLNAAPITKCWREHLTGHHDWKYLLWDVLTFQAWLRWSEVERTNSRAAPRLDLSVHD